MTKCPPSSSSSGADRMDFMRLALVIYDPDGLIVRDLWSRERFWTSNVLYTLVWAGHGWMWNRAWGPYALATLEKLDVESPIRKSADCYIEISQEDVLNPQRALSKVHEVLSTHPLVAVPWPVLVERSWKLQPKKVALTCGDQKVTYEEFVAYAGIVQRMVMRTMGSGTHVLVTFSDTPSSRLTWAVVMYALAASGVPFSLMDKRTLLKTPARERVLERWEPKAWICCDPEAHTAPVGGMVRIPFRTDVVLDLAGKQVVVDGVRSPVQFPVKAPHILATAESPCFVDWTSGSTSGLPKGVVTTHKTLINMMLWAWCDERMFFNGGAMHEVVAANLFLLWYWWQPLCIGASTVLIQDKELTDLEVHVNKLRSDEVTIVDCMTPSLLGAMIDYVNNEDDASAKLLPSKIVVSGEPLSEQVCRKFFATQPKESRLVNLFSTTETGDAAFYSMTAADLPLWADSMAFAPIGSPIWNIKLHIEDTKENGAMNSGEGELFVDHIGGTMSYVNDREQTCSGFSSQYGWRSRDRVRSIYGLGLVILGRADDNVKIRGFKVDLRLVESKCRDLKGVAEVCAMAVEEELVVAYTVTGTGRIVEPGDLLDSLRGANLPEGHVPQRAILWEGNFPMMKTGKVDKNVIKRSVCDSRRSREKGPTHDVKVGRQSVHRPVDARVAAVWEDTLGIDFDIDGSFWRQCGGQSLTAMRIAASLRIPAKLMLDGTLDTPRDIINYLTQNRGAPNRGPHLGVGLERSDAERDRRIAVIGASGRWPGIGQTSFSSLLEALSGKSGPFNPFTVPPDGHTGVGNVPGGYYLDPALVSGFDIDFWARRGVSDPVLLDPHQRMWLEMAYEALTDGGMGPAMENGDAINCGVFVSGGSLPHYLTLLLEPGETLPSVRVSDPDRYFSLEMGNDKDYIAMRTSHALNLTGPSVCIGTACSAALVAVCQAVQALRDGACDTALCGGVSLVVPQNEHASQDGMIWSSDGKCKPFTDQASGTANSNGGHCFLLKPYEDALRDDDPVYCLISGIGVCNDGAGKPFSAPSVDGHERAIRAAQSDCGNAVSGDVRMIEAHATGTYVGDPIEAEALAGQYWRKKGSGRISVGSVKGNIGHANTAAGAMGFAKAVMCVYEGVLVPSGSSSEGDVNPLLSHRLEASNMELQRIFEPWSGSPRVAAVSALGIGGTNAHVIIESVPQVPRALSSASEGHPIYIALSSYDQEGLQEEAKALTEFLQSSPAPVDLVSVAYTLSKFRPSLPYRSIVEVMSSSTDAMVSQLASVDFEDVHECPDTCECVTLVCPGQGLTLPQPGTVSIEPEVVSLLGEDPVLTYHRHPNPVTQQVALFSISYSTTLRLLRIIHKGTRVQLLGASLGEWVAATVCGVMPLKQALQVVRLRARLITEGNTGKMLAINGLTMEELPNLPRGVEVACVNADKRIVVSGTPEGIESFKTTLEVPSKVLDTAGAFHSYYVDAAVDVLESQIPVLVPELKKPSKYNLISTATHGDGDFDSVRYWCRQTRRTVMLERALKEAGRGGTMFIDVGPGAGMRTLIRECVPDAEVLCAARYFDKSYQALRGAMWSSGIVSEPPVPDGEGLRRALALPSRRWRRTKCWPPDRSSERDSCRATTASGLASMTYTEVWEELPVALFPNDETPGRVAGISLSGTEPSCGEVLWCRSVSDFDVAVRSLGRAVVLVDPEPDADPISLLGDVIKFVQRSLIPNSRLLSRMDTVLVIRDCQCASPVIGFARSLVSEHGADLGLRIVRVLNTNDIPSLARLPNLGEFRVVGGKIRVRQLGRDPQRTPKSDLKEHLLDGVVVITGGFGGLGRLVAKWAADNLRCSKIVLVGRSASSQPSSLGLSCPVEVRAADVSSRDSLVSALSEYRGTVTTVFHCAGVVEDALVEHAPSIYEELYQAVAAKVLGPVNLVEALGSEPRYVLFSSSSSAFGSPGQSVYAAANAASDFFADNSAADVLSIQWGGWSKSIVGSMSAKYNVNPAAGERFLAPQQGLQAMATLLGELVAGNLKSRNVVVADVSDWEQYLSAAGLPREAPLWSRLLPEPGPSWIPSIGQLATNEELSWMVDHRTEGGIVVPATAMILWLIGYPKFTTGALEKVAFNKVLWADKGQHVETTHGEVRDGDTVYASATRREIKRDQPNYVRRALTAESASADGGWNTVEVCDLYQRYYNEGFFYGPSFRLLKSAKRRDGMMMATVSDGRHLAAVMDACTHACALLDPAAFGGYPSNIRSVRFELDHPDGEGRTDWEVIVKKSEVNALARSFDLVLHCPCSGHWITFEGFTMQTTTSTSTLHVYRVGDAETLDSDDIRSRILSSRVMRPMVGPVEIPEDYGGPQGCGEYVITPAGSGDLDATFAPVQFDGGAVAPGFVRVSAENWGLSFLDALAATGAMPMSFFGGELSGIVTAVGEGAGITASASLVRVHHVHPGDLVGCVTLGASGLRSTLLLPAEFCYKVPSNISPAAASALPMSYATSILALDLRAGLDRGPKRTVLVHSAAGGVGLSCVAWLSRRGHHVMGTCSLKDGRKVEMLQKQGVSEIFDSRDVSSWYVPLKTGKAPRPAAIIGALDGDQLSRSFEVVASNGFILDLAKKEQMLEAVNLPLSHFLRGVTYSACHLDEFMRTAEPAEVSDLMRRVWEEASATVRTDESSMPVTIYPCGELKRALEVLTTGKNIGKVVVRMEPPMQNGLPHTTIVDMRRNEDPVQGAALVATPLDSSFVAEPPTVTVRAPEVIPVDLLRPLANLEPAGAAYVAVPEPPQWPASPVWHGCCETSSASSSTDVDGKLAILTAAVRQRGNASVLGPMSDEELASRSLEELGFDSLARLQLSAAIRKLSPGVRGLVGSELVGHLPLSQLVAKKPRISRPLGSHRGKWLALHGFRTNSELFAQQLAGLGDFLGVDFIFVNAPHEAHGPGYGGSISAADCYEWWWKGESEDKSYETGWIGAEGLLSSQRFLREQVQRVKPDGVVGFSQGGGMAYWMLCEGLVKKGVLFSPVGPAGSETYKPADSTNIVVVRSTRADEASATFCDDTIGGDSFLAHEQGHAVPRYGDEKYKKLYDIMLQRLDLHNDAVKGA